MSENASRAKTKEVGPPLLRGSQTLALRRELERELIQARSISALADAASLARHASYSRTPPTAEKIVSFCHVPPERAETIVSILRRVMS